MADRTNPTDMADPTDMAGTKPHVAVLNHVELVYRPGERALARRLFELLGAEVRDSGGPFLVMLLEPGQTDFVSNVYYASEVNPTQWALEQELAKALGPGGVLHDAVTPYRERLAAAPQFSSHFGMRVPDGDAYEAMLERVRRAGEHDPELAGRVRVAGVFRPGDPGSLTDAMIQSFVQTDVVATGMLAFGQIIEVQYHLAAT